jgi:uncharacterized protein (TIGR03437 family)
MRLRTFSLLLATSTVLSAANPFIPVISPNGVVNAASYLAGAFPGYGIARGSIFLVFGSALGPVNLTQATSFPLPTTDGLAGTRVLVSVGAFNTTCPMIYTSINQVAAIMPSNTPEGDGTLVVSYQNLASTSVPIHVVHSAFGIFTRSEAGGGPAVVQHQSSQNPPPINSLALSALPGQTAILWGTGLGPVAGDDGAGPLPGALPGLDSLYVGGLQANVRYAGRSGCCAGLDEIIFDVPTGVSGCYVPVAAVTGGVVSNFGTISVNPKGGECDDPLSFSASDIMAAERSGVLRRGQVALSGTSGGEVDLSASFLTNPIDVVLSATSLVNPSLGACYLSVTPMGAAATTPGMGLNAGNMIGVNGPVGPLAAQNTSSGGYFQAKAPANLSAGMYTFTGTGGSDVGAFSTALNLAPPAVWTNMAIYNVPAVPLASPLTFNWTGGDPAGWVTIKMTTANAIYTSALQCNVSPSARTFTIPAFLINAMYASPATISLGSASPVGRFTATGIDTGVVSMGTAVAVQTVMQQLAK